MFTDTTTSNFLSPQGQEIFRNQRPKTKRKEIKLVVKEKKEKENQREKTEKGKRQKRNDTKTQDYVYY